MQLSDEVLEGDKFYREMIGGEKNIKMIVEDAC
jgi:hypothetical protein